MLIEVENTVNLRPLTHVPIEDSAPALTPNHFLLGSSNGTKPFTNFDDTVVTLRQNWCTSQILANQYWKYWVSDYLPDITRHTKWFQRVKPIAVGDIVIFADSNMPRNCWPKEKVISIKVSKDGQVRSATVRTVFVVLSMALAFASCVAVDDSSKKDKRGLWKLGYGQDSHGFEDHHHEVKHQITTITKNVPVPYPVEIEKHVPVEVNVPYPVHVEKKVPVYVEKKVPVYVEKKVPVHVDRPVPYPVEVKVPVVHKEYVEVPKPYAVHVEKPVPVYVHKPVYIEKHVPVTVHIKEHKKKHWGLF
ncbi:uncharacterized protein LOC135714560 [Ochlerotatus camptorhynchus]|uniref:uncharacterized protein LOC135714560 n=1 Tax=Ochlerotatus camptorhynchus TaxID=644619 RepID=UPI0031DB5E3C